MMVLESRTGAASAEASGELLSTVSRSAILCAAFAMVPATAFAQTAQDTTTATSQGSTSSTSAAPSDKSEIVVTGVRAAIFKALKTKRNAQSIVDSISAEDVGKLPDSNIAEAVQRIPGVSIDREGGEGRHISINGFGPELTLTLFNGRQIASSDATRSFSFDTIASNLVSQVNVYKTLNADIPEGGLGGTIDVRTARPFDFKGLNGSVQVSYNYDGNSKKGFPQASAILSDRFFDDRLGVLVSFTHQKRRNETLEVHSNGGWGTNYFIDPVTHAYLYDARQDTWRVWDLENRQTISNRERNGGTAVIQFQATDKLTLTADYLYSKFTVKDVRDGGGAYLWAVLCDQQGVPMPPSDPRYDPGANDPDPSQFICLAPTSGTTIDDNGFYTHLQVSGGTNPVTGLPNKLGSFLTQHTTSERPTTQQLAGFNVEWNPSAKFKGVVDAYWSQAINNNRGLDHLDNFEFGQQPEYAVDFPATGVPTFDLMGNDLLAPQNIEQHVWLSQVYNTGTHVKAINKGVRGDFDWAPNPSLHFRFGGNYSNESKAVAYYQTPRLIDQLYHFLRGPNQLFPTSVISDVIYPGQAFGQGSDAFPVFVLDENALRTWMADPANLAARAPGQTVSSCASGSAIRNAQCTLDAFLANGSSWDADVRTNSNAASRVDQNHYEVGEKDFSVYGEIVKDFELGDIPVNLVAGLRYSKTDLTSTGVTTILTGYTPNTSGTGNPDALTAVYETDANGNLVRSPVTYKNSYHELLPSLNIKFDLRPDLVFRLAATRTMSRPTLNQIEPFIGGFSGTTKRRTASGGNPFLRPFTSKNLDASLEWYYSKRGAIAVAGFYKDAKDFIVPTTVVERIPTITTTSPGVALTLDELQTTYVNGPGNAASAKIKGVTAAWTHAFPFGFGFQLNYTKLWSKARVNPEVTTGQTSFAVPGISDTANVIAFYEKGPISARVAWNWRSAFLSVPGDGFNQPLYGDAYYQIDARLGVDVGRGVNLAASVINLTNRNVRYYSWKKQYFQALYSYGRQFMFSATKKF